MSQVPKADRVLRIDPEGHDTPLKNTRPGPQTRCR